ncbi:hypothetical protein I6E81_06360 [Salinibacterium sp. NG22]|uniref:hypothetical protein n=1 Tax=Salinibacterium sp. NG22 TaxID=2792040 RepID=UPI0018CD1E3F|nr:hypothetical protein [Salinibacterium sp. NG22]MBH0109785.1 hypothetical protein [Salinibacterium sp. NG22]
MTDEESLRLVSQFWVPFVTIVPVIAVAYIFEARLIASLWTMKHKWLMALQGMIVAAGGATLVYLEAKGLLAIVNLSFDHADVTQSLAFLVVVMAVVVGYPLVHIYMIAVNPSIEIATAVALTPLTWFAEKVSKKRTAKAQELEESAEQLVAQIDRAVDDQETLKTRWVDLSEETADLDQERVALIQSQIDERTAAIASLRERREEASQIIEGSRAKQASLVTRLNQLREFTSIESANARAEKELQKSTEKLARAR